jgi:hypothetical protein
MANDEMFTILMEERKALVPKWIKTILDCE